MTDTETRPKVDRRIPKSERSGRKVKPTKEPKAPRRSKRSQQAEESSALRHIMSSLLTVLVVAVLGLSAVVVGYPKVIGAVPLTILTGSMEPTYMPGDIVVVKKIANPSHEISVGDVVTYQPEANNPDLITHRVISKSLGGAQGAVFILQGDNNGAVDDPVLPKQIMGKVIYSIPKVGLAAKYVGGAKSGGLSILAFGLIGYCLLMLVRPGKR